MNSGWQIGTASASSCGNSGCNDPGTDHTSYTCDNKIAGYIIGGCNAQTVNPSMLYLTSPVIDLSSTPGALLTLKFWRWFVLDYPTYMVSVLEAFNGTAWNTLWYNPARSSGGPYPCDGAWSQVSYDISSYKTSSFQFRFGTQVTSTSVFVVGGMSIDDVEIWSY